jgi:hypothetical protein
MASRDYFEMLWRHVFVGARVRTVEAGPKLSVLVLETPTAAASVNSETLRVELRSPGDLVDWHERYELIVAGGDFDFEAAPRDGGDTVLLTLPAETMLGRVQTDASKSLSQMKMASLARPSIEAANGLPSLEVLQEVRDRAVDAVGQRLAAAGFRGASPVWVRDGVGCTQAVVRNNSRFNTRFMIAFWFDVFVLLGETRQTPKSFGALVAACAGPANCDRPPPKIFSVSAVDPSGAAVIDEAARHARDVLVPWFDANRTPRSE